MYFWAVAESFNCMVLKYLQIKGLVISKQKYNSMWQEGQSKLHMLWAMALTHYEPT